MTSRADLHCHSTASQLSRLGVQRSLGLPECATPPEEVYELAKKRGMDFVTITDHDTIAGALELEGLPDTFVSEELTARFAGEPQAVHVLCFGITPGDHEWLQAHAGDVEACAAYLHGGGIACALAHPFYNVAAPLTRRHRRRLAEIFPIWEVRNGSRAAELNMPAAVYVDTRGGTGIGGSDDHAGVDIGRTFTEVPVAATPEEFLAHLRTGHAEARGEQGSAAKWTHAAMAIATRALGEAEPNADRVPGRDTTADADRSDAAASGRGASASRPTPDPAAVMKMAERVIAEGSAREGKVAADVGPEDARCLLEAWLAGVGIEARGRELLDLLQADDFSHADLYRRARRRHERRLRLAVDGGLVAFQAGDLGAAASGIFEALVPAIPYAPSTAFLGAEKSKLRSREEDRRRVALIADGIGQVHGVTHTIEQIRERGVPGFDVDVIGTDPGVDRRLPAAAELDAPFYAGLRLGVPGVPDLVEALAEGDYDLVHVTAPGPAGIAATLLSRITGVPTIASYHTELAAYAGLRADGMLEAVAEAGLGAFYSAPARVLSPSPAADASLAGLGVDGAAVGRWERGVDTERFDPAKADRDAFPGEVKVLYAGRLAREKGIELLADSFLRAHEADPRLHLLLAGGGPEEGELRERLGDAATFLGWLEGEELAVAYASADIFCFCSVTDTFGQVILEAGASGLPTVAIAEGGPAALVENRHTGLLCRPDADHVAGSLLQLAASPELRTKLGAAAIRAARARSWERSMSQLAAGYRLALDSAAATAPAVGRREASQDSFAVAGAGRREAEEVPSAATAARPPRDADPASTEASPVARTPRSNRSAVPSGPSLKPLRRVA